MKKKMLVVAFILFMIAIFYYNQMQEPEWYVSGDGILHYPLHRGKIVYTRSLIEDNMSYTVDKVIYKSRGKDIYGLLFRPKIKGKVPVVIALPAARARKEQHKVIADIVLGQGYAYFVIDQRGIGETGGLVPPALHDFNDFLADKEPFQHLMIYDALRAFDFVSRQKDLDDEKIIYFGSSMGGRTAIIATALEPRVKGVIAYSTAGYPPQQGKAARFIMSFNPNTYVSMISPRKLIMFHSVNDTVIPLQDAKITYGLAKEPKELIIMSSACNHGFCPEEVSNFVKKLNELLA